MAIESGIKLLGSGASPYVTRAKFALKLKSLDYEYIDEDLTKKSELLLKSNPGFQTVPVLFHANELPICNSLIIIEYLDEILSNVYPILPSNPEERAESRYWSNYVDSLFIPWMREFMITQEKERKEELKNNIIEGSKLLEDALVKLSHGKTFFGGDDIGYLDIVLGCFLGWTKFFGLMFGFKVIDELRNPKLTQWEKSMWLKEVTKSVIPSDDMHMDFFKALYQHING